MATPYKLRNAAIAAGYEGEQIEKRFVLAVLKTRNENGSRKSVKQVARDIGISEQALHRFMKGRIVLECDWIDVEPITIDVQINTQDKE